LEKYQPGRQHGGIGVSQKAKKKKDERSAKEAQGTRDREKRAKRGNDVANRQRITAKVDWKKKKGDNNMDDELL